MAGVDGLLCGRARIALGLADTVLSGSDALLSAARHRHSAHRAAVAAEQGCGLCRVSAPHQRLRSVVHETRLEPLYCAGRRPRLALGGVNPPAAAAAG